MRSIQSIRNKLVRRPGSAVLLASLLWAATGLAERSDPVEELRQALKKPSPDRNLSQRIQALRSLTDMRRALGLQDWHPETDTTDELAVAERQAQSLLAQRFKKEVRRVLRHGSAAGRLAAMRMLAEMGPGIRASDPEDRKGIARTFAPDLAGLVKSGDTPRARETAARTLGQIFPDPDVAVPALRDLLSSRNVGERRAAVSGLASLMRVAGQLASRASTATGVEADPGDIIQAVRDVVPLASRGLADPDIDVRRSSAEALQQAAAALNNQVPQPRTAEEPIDLQTEPRKLELARTTLLPLMELFREQTPAIAKALSDPDLEVRLLTQRALEELGSARQRLMRAPTLNPAPAGAPQPGGARGAALDRGELAAVALKLQAAAPPDPLLEGLRTLLPVLAAHVADPNVQARLGAIDVLETLGPAAEPAAPALVRALCDPDRFVRWAAARTLGKMGPVQPATAVPGIARLLYDDDLDVRLAAALALDRFGPAARAAVPDLIRAMRASDAEMRIAAMRTLEGIGTDAQPAVPALGATLSDSDPRVRQVAAEVLGRFGPLASSAEPALRRALDDPNSDVRRAASDALLNILQSEK